MTKLLSTFKNILITLVCICFFSKAVFALTVVPSQPLSFGTFAFGNLSQIMQVTVNTDGSFSSNANTILVNSPTNGEYTISDGTAGMMYTITVPASVPLSGPNVNDLTINQIAVTPAAGTFDGFGTTTISVGGRLQSNGGGAQYNGGSYTGTIDLTFNY